ncbi:MAG TPA: beta-galactosidase [Phycisphaerae bacterium]|nr:beta-galactosidase [Phycisphaerae bacterium]
MGDEYLFAGIDRRNFLRIVGLASAAGLFEGCTESTAAMTAPTTAPSTTQNSIQNLPPRQFSHPDRVRYDSQCLYVENKPFLMYSGEFHYCRCPKPLWRARFEKIKDAGFNTVQVYVMWNYHERQMPDSVDDFSKVDLTDLEDWLTMAEEFGLYVSMRPGPYVCAEWNTGGFPQWLLTKKPPGYTGEQNKGAWLRTDDPDFIAWSRHWYKAVCPVIAPHQITRKKPGEPGVILFQVENEYKFVKWVSDQAQRKVLGALARQAWSCGIDVPLFVNYSTCVIGSADPVIRQMFYATDEYPRFNIPKTEKALTTMAREQPDAPLMTAELQGGWFDKVTGPQSFRTDSDYYTPSLGPAQINNLTMMCLQCGVTLMNYYMVFGGTNMDAWAARNISTSYDYSAPIRECGGVGEKFLRVKAIAKMLQKHGTTLAQSVAVKVKAQTTQDDVEVAARKALDGSYYIFIRTSQNKEERKGTAAVSIDDGPSISFDYELEPFGAKIFYLPAVNRNEAAHWLPETQTLPPRPTNLPGPVAITEVRSEADAVPSVWGPKPDSLASLGDYIGGFSYYNSINAIQGPAPTSLRIEQLNPGGVTAQFNGIVLFSRKDGVTPAALDLPADVITTSNTTNQLYLVYEDYGHTNTGMSMEKLSGIAGVNVEPPPPIVTDDKAAQMLQYGGGPTGIGLGWQNPEFDDSSWAKINLLQQAVGGGASGLLTWHRMTFTLPVVDASVWVPWCIHLEASGNGFIFINGHNIGRYWQNGGQKDFFLPDCWLNTGPGNKNVIVLCLRGVDKPAGVLSASIVPYTAYAEYRGISHD